MQTMLFSLVKQSILRTSRMHVVRRTTKQPHEVSTVMFSRTPYHGKVVWQSEPQLSVNYDSESHVLYVSADGSKQAVSEAEKNGLILQISLKDDRPCGVTVISYKNEWSSHRQYPASRVSDLLHVSKGASERALEFAPV